MLLLFSRIWLLVTAWTAAPAGFPGGSDGRESACNAGDLGPLPVSERSPGEGNGNPLQCSCLENPMDRGAWRATVCGVRRSRHNWSDFIQTAACQSPLSSTISQSLLKFMSTESLCHRPKTNTMSYTSYVHECVLSHDLLFYDPIDWSPPGSPAHGIFQARILERVAIFFSKGFSQPRDQTHISCLSCMAGNSLPAEPPGKPKSTTLQFKKRKNQQVKAPCGWRARIKKTGAGL